MCVILTAESVTFTCWPPAPPARYVSIFRSCGLISTSTSSASGSTATVTADVCILPDASVAGTLWTRCTPFSYFKRLCTSLPLTENITSLKPPAPAAWLSIISIFQPWFAEYLEYILNRSPAKSDASAPPVPALISMITSLFASGSSSSTASSSSSSMSFFLLSSSPNSLFAISASSPCVSFSIIFLASWISCNNFL